MLGAARDALGADVKINDINVSVFSGVSLKGVAVANPEGYPGQLLTADAFVLRYRLLPLLRRRVEIEEVSLRKPTIELVRGDKGQWNYEKLTAKTEQPTPAGAPPKAPTSTKPSAKPGNFEISLSKLLMTDGNVVLLSDKNKELLKVQDINLSSSIRSGWRQTERQRSGKHRDDRSREFSVRAADRLAAESFSGCDSACPSERQARRRHGLG